MTQHILKKGVQDFTVIDGPMAGKSYKRGVAYEDIPQQEAAKFEVATEAVAAAALDPSATKSKKDKI